MFCTLFVQKLRIVLKYVYATTIGYIQFKIQNRFASEPAHRLFAHIYYKLKHITEKYAPDLR